MTKPTVGVPHRPARVTSVEFETNARPDATPAEQFSAMLMARTVGHLEQVDAGAIISAWLEEVDARLDPACLQDLGGEALGLEILHMTALIETVLDLARQSLTKGMSLDHAVLLVPRLKGTRSL